MKKYQETKTLKIAGEIDQYLDLMKIDTHSEYSKHIGQLFKQIKPRRIIETGTYLGAGSTAIITSALKELEIGDCVFYSIEVNPLHYKHAVENLTKTGLIDFVTPVNGLSLPRNLLPGVEEIEEKFVKNLEFEDIFVDHKAEDRAILYFLETNFEDLPDDLLGKYIMEFDYQPDFLMLDSAGHIGFIEFNYVVAMLKGPCVFAIDDTCHVKHHKSLLKIKSDRRFEIIEESREKFGFCTAIFTP
ncbi:glycosyl transferase family 9 [Candidatus Magnetobacterium bavaricum]|uniref:Glycosyl transferase family 9 n=1 Tax=Candidatus Magnetobacterium bavaricum TaxID=29290 RepID=A0A0F3GTP2_9BACT|nr:glycosyl transferase family 9 [Candidatus Magnetobacterium bavaricum]